MDFDNDKVEADIRAAIAEVSGDAPAAPAAPVEGVDTNTPPETDAAEVVVDAEGRSRAKDGKFAAKQRAETEPTEPVGAKAPNEAPDPKVKPEDKVADEKALTPPSHWSPQAKSDFMAAPRSVQQQVLKREGEIEDARKDWGTKAEDYNKLDKVLSPHRDRWARDGKSPDVAISQLLAAEGAIQKSPVEGLEYLLRTFVGGRELQTIDQIARRHGYQLTKATNQGTAPDGAATPSPTNAPDPTVRRLESDIHELSQKLAARDSADAEAQRSAEQSRIASLEAEVSAVATDPKNLYFENLREQIAALVSIGDKKNDTRPIRVRVQEAYNDACYADPTVRALVLAEAQRKTRDANDAAAKAKAEAARAAGGSVTGSPGQGAPAPKPGSTSNSRDGYEASVRAAVASHRA